MRLVFTATLSPATEINEISEKITENTVIFMVGLQSVTLIRDEYRC